MDSDSNEDRIVSFKKEESVAYYGIKSYKRSTLSGIGSSARFFLLFLTANFLVTGAVSLALYLKAPGVLEEQTIDLNRRLLLQFSRTLDTSLSQVDFSLRQLTMDSSLQIIPEYKRNRNTDALLRINENLNNLRVINPYIQSLNFLFRSQNVVFIPNAGLLSLDEAPDADFLEKIRSGEIRPGWKSVRVVRDFATDREIPVLSVIKLLDPSRDLDAYVIINIAEEYLKGLSDASRVSSGTELLLVRREEILSRLSDYGYYDKLSSYSEMDQIFSRDQGSFFVHERELFLVTFASSSVGEWSYLSILPMPLIMRQVRILRNDSLLVIILGLTASLTVSLLFSRRMKNMLKSLISLVKPESGSSNADPLENLESGIMELREYSLELEQSVKEQLPVLRNNLLLKLFAGRFDSQEDLSSDFAAYELSIGGKDTYLCLALSFSPSGTTGESGRARDLSAVIVLDQLRKAVPENCEMAAAFTRDDEVALLIGFNSPGSAADAVTEGHLSSRIKKKVEEMLNVPAGSAVLMGVGTPHSGISSVPDSYREARIALRCARMSMNCPLIRYNQIRHSRTNDAMWVFEEEDALADALKQGKEGELEKRHAAIMAAVNSPEGFYLAFSLLGTVLRVCQEAGINLSDLGYSRDLYADLSLAAESSGTDEWFRILYGRILRITRERLSSRNRGVAEKTAAYIRENYRNELSLHVLSRQVYLSEAYLSRIFHEEMGMPLKHYINMVRIDHAKRLLRETYMKVGDIAKDTGYDKLHGFLKFFKEQTGMTPKNYRYSHCGNTASGGDAPEQISYRGEI